MVPRRMFEWGWGSAAAVWAMQWMGHKSLCCPPPSGRAAHDIYVGDLSAMQFNIPGPLRVCVCVCMSEHIPPPCATPMPTLSHLEPPKLHLLPIPLYPPWEDRTGTRG